MKANRHHKSPIIKPEIKDDSEGTEFPGYPLYPPSDDIYSRAKEVRLDPDLLSKNPQSDIRMEKDLRDDIDDNGLDVPGAELDDQQENIGSEDEENNYYSLGGDNHNDLEEDKGD